MCYQQLLYKDNVIKYWKELHLSLTSWPLTLCIIWPILQQTELKFWKTKWFNLEETQYNF